MSDSPYNLSYLASHEWLETNSLGGYASGTVGGMATRRYHGLLIAAIDSPANRMMAINRLEESLQVGSEVHFLSSSYYPGTIYPEGYQHITAFERGILPVWTFEVGGYTIRKRIGMIQGENTTVVTYEFLAVPQEARFVLRPLYASRNHHHLAAANSYIWPDYLVEKEGRQFRTINYLGCPEILITVSAGEFHEDKCWYYHHEYPAEQERGLEYQEDLYSHGYFEIPVKKGLKLSIILTTEDKDQPEGFKLLDSEVRKRVAVFGELPGSGVAQLRFTARQFLVRHQDKWSVVAGYPWFTEWGRDTMISLPGMLLDSGQVKEARSVLETFLGAMKDGLIPNRFPDAPELPEYNSMDATLWMFNAFYLYYNKTLDKPFLKKYFPVLQESLRFHLEGTVYGIHADPDDQLLTGGHEGIQLTWMDARIGDYVITPRMGKPVEVNALWYNALRIMEFLSQEVRKISARYYGDLAESVQRNFHNAFVRHDGLGCYDVVTGHSKSLEIRPNQIFAVSLPFPVLTGTQAREVVDTVESRLLTPAGLRSLDPADPRYQECYAGNIWSRDGAYHQGTVWGWLLGPFIDAMVKVRGQDAIIPATRLVDEYLTHYLDAYCVGTLPELADGQEPHNPKGSIAQAWSVAEILRVIHLYELPVS